MFREPKQPDGKNYTQPSPCHQRWQGAQDSGVYFRTSVCVFAYVGLILNT